MSDLSTSRFWDKYILKTNSYKIKPSAAKWYVRHAETLAYRNWWQICFMVAGCAWWNVFVYAYSILILHTSKSLYAMPRARKIALYLFLKNLVLLSNYRLSLYVKSILMTYWKDMAPSICLMPCPGNTRMLKMNLNGNINFPSSCLLLTHVQATCIDVIYMKTAYRSRLKKRRIILV